MAPSRMYDQLKIMIEQGWFLSWFSELEKLLYELEAEEAITSTEHRSLLAFGKRLSADELEDSEERWAQAR